MSRRTKRLIYDAALVYAQMNMTTIRARLKQRWKMLAVVVGIWIVVMFPIPFLPLLGFPYDVTSVRILLMISAIVSIPFTLLALFMNDGGNNRNRARKREMEPAGCLQATDFS
jgi:uncharacterized membrane protein